MSEPKTPTIEDHKKDMMSDLADLKEYESHDLKDDLVVDVVDGNFSPCIDALKQKIKKLPESDCNLKPAFINGFDLEELLERFLMWSQKDEDVAANKVNIDKACRRLLAFGKFFAEYATVFKKPLDENSSLRILESIGMQGPDKFEHDADGRLVVIASFKNMSFTDPKVKQLHARKKAQGLLETEFLRAYTWNCFQMMKDKASAHQGCVMLINYNFMSMSLAGEMQSLFGKMKKSVGKLFHGTCPIKIKSLILLNCPWWIRMLMAFARLFVSSKIMSRMHIMGAEHKKLATYFGGPKNIPNGYFEFASDT